MNCSVTSYTHGDGASTRGQGLALGLVPPFYLCILFSFSAACLRASVCLISLFLVLPHMPAPNTAHQSQSSISLQNFLIHSIHRWRTLEVNEGFLTALCNQFDCLNHVDLEVMLYLMGPLMSDESAKKRYAGIKENHVPKGQQQLGTRSFTEEHSQSQGQSAL